jgi:hypothetical protein
VVEYAADEEFGIGSRTFPAFLRGDLINLRSTRGAAHKEAERTNNAFWKKRRDSLRTLLRAAARKKMLPWGESRLTHFNVEGTRSADAAVFINLDEQLEGDSKFSAIVCN